MKTQWELMRDDIVAILNKDHGSDPESYKEIVQRESTKESEAEFPTNGKELTFSEDDFEHEMKSIQPGGRITSEMGMRIHPISGKEKFHGGVDIGSLDKGAKAYAIHDAEVTFAGRAGSAGNMVTLAYKSGEDIHEILYMHLDSIAVNKGQEVTKHQVIGVVGNTGGSKGRHLHLEHRINGKKTRPTSTEVNMSVMREVA